MDTYDTVEALDDLLSLMAWLSREVATKRTVAQFRALLDEYITHPAWDDARIALADATTDEEVPMRRSKIAHQKCQGCHQRLRGSHRVICMACQRGHGCCCSCWRVPPLPHRAAGPGARAA